VIVLTHNAASEIRSVLEDKGIPNHGLRIQVVGGGCEGFLYDLLYVDLPDAEDRVFEQHGVKVIVDPRSLAAVDGLTIDHGKGKYGTGFLFENPSAKRSCSCGASFSA
jgi:iron-sulfur cluster assembly accessory protein